MKATILFSATIIGALSAAITQAATGDVSTVQGCQVVDMGGYSNKVDPTCTFSHQPGGNGLGAAAGSGLPGDLDDLLGGLFGN